MIRVEVKEDARDFQVTLGGKRIGMLRFFGGRGCESYTTVPEPHDPTAGWLMRINARFLDWHEDPREAVQRILGSHGFTRMPRRRDVLDRTERVNVVMRRVKDA